MIKKALQKLKGNGKTPEEKRAEEGNEVYNIVKNLKNANVHEAVQIWKEYLKVVSNSEFKDMYQPKDVQNDIKERVYEMVKTTDSKDLKAKVDEILTQPNNGYKPLAEMLSEVNSKPEDVQKHCLEERFNAIGNNQLELVGSMIDAMNEKTKTEFKLYDVIQYDKAMQRIDELNQTFKSNKGFAMMHKDREINLDRVIIEYGIRTLESYVGKDKNGIFSDMGIELFEMAKEVTERYIQNETLKSANKDLSKHLKLKGRIAKVQKAFDEGYKQFEASALTKQDTAYNRVLESAETGDPYYETELGAFVEFSRTYSKVLEESPEELKKTIEKLGKIERRVGAEMERGKAGRYDKLSDAERAALINGG